MSVMSVEFGGIVVLRLVIGGYRVQEVPLAVRGGRGVETDFSVVVVSPVHGDFVAIATDGSPR
jgi:hypothetical protein